MQWDQSHALPQYTVSAGTGPTGPLLCLCRSCRAGAHAVPEELFVEEGWLIALAGGVMMQAAFWGCELFASLSFLSFL